MFDTLGRYVLRQCTTRFLLLFVLFLCVLVGGQLGIFVGQGVPPEACLPLVQQLVEFSLSIALPLALSTAILVIIGTMNQDGEIRALAASGVNHMAVVVRVIPLVVCAVAACLLLTNWVMPNAVANIRASKGHLAQSMIAQKVAIDEPVMQKDGFSVWVGAADGTHLHNVRALVKREDTFSAIFAPEAHWVLSDRGIHLEFTDAQLLQRRADGRLTAIDAPVWDYLWTGDEKSPGQSEPDGLPTAQVYRLTQTPPAVNLDPSDYNNARLTLQFRFFLPLSLISFSLFALGMGLTFGTAQNLPGILIVVLTVALAIWPAFGYVKTNVHHAQINPGWLLWPPSIGIAALGLWMSWRPERAREVLSLPFALFGPGRSA